MKIIAAIIAVGALSLSAAHAEAPTMRICTGSKDLNYYKAGMILAANVHAVTISKDGVIATAGSVDNLNRIDRGECDGGFTQIDALLDFKHRNSSAYLTVKRVAEIYPEYLFLICNDKRAPLDKITGLRDGKSSVAVGAAGSGMAATMNAFRIADKGYEKVRTEPTGGQQALNDVIDGATGCMMQVSGTRAQFLADAAQPGFGVGKIHFVPTDDSDLLRTELEPGVPLYRAVTLKGSENLAIRDLFKSCGFFSSCSLDTISVASVFVVRSDWVNAHQAEYGAFIRELRYAIPAIRKEVGAPALAD